MSKVAVITAWDEKYQPIADVTVPILQAYCERHGYTLHTGPYTTDLANLRDYGDRGKIDLFCQVYDTHDTVMFLDVDAIVMNHNIKIEHQQNHRAFAWTYHGDGPCSGFWIAATTPLVRQMLLTVQRLAQERGNVMVAERIGPPHSVVLQMEPRGASDQDVMTHLLSVPPFSIILGHESTLRPGKELGHCIHDYAYHGWAGLESMGQYEPGDWIVTAPSYPFEERLAILKSYAEKLLLCPERGSSIAVERPVEMRGAPLAEPFDRNWAGPLEHAPRMFRTQSEKDTWHACVVDNEYNLPEKLASEDVVIDIGAHIGSFSYAAYQRGSRRIHAYEIDPWHIEAGKLNLAGLEDAIEYAQAAIVRGDEHRAKTYRYSGAWNSFGIVGPEVRSASLDEVISAVCADGSMVRFLKIDIEGGEWPVLYTCNQLDCVQEIAGEWHIVPSDDVPELASLPYEISASGLFGFLVSRGFDDVSVMPAIGCETSIGHFHAKRRRSGLTWEAPFTWEVAWKAPV